MVAESPYIRWVRNKDAEPDQQYVYELNVLRAMVRQEDRPGDVGWGGTWTKGRYQRLKDKRPEAVLAFEAELGERGGAAAAGDPRKYGYSAYLEEQTRTYPNKYGYLKALKRLRNVMILFKVGYGSREIAMLRVNSKRRYPEAYEAFERKVEDP